MFTGIIETMGEVTRLQREAGNLHITMRSNLADSLKIDQSLAHNGVCLTVITVEENTHTVTAIAETLAKSSLGFLQVGSFVNLERAMLLGSRLDGHLVQGHVDQTAVCKQIQEEAGSRRYTFTYAAESGQVTIEKGSITIDGVSLTVVNSEKASFEVAIIPYTYAHTLFKYYEVGTIVNLEFDIIGKYVARLMPR